MKKNYKKLIIFLLIINVSGIFILIFSNYINKNKNKPAYYLNGLPVYNANAIYAYDVSSPEKAYAASRYVFIAKINNIDRTEYENKQEIETGLFSKKTVTDPVTIYNISVIKNIKGNLITNEEIELKQFGGINEDNKSYTFVENGNFLEVDGYYLFLTGADTDGGLIEVTNPQRIIYLGSNLEKIKEIENGKILENSNLSKSEKNKYQKICEYFSVNVDDILEKDNKNDGPILTNISKYDICYQNNNCDTN